MRKASVLLFLQGAQRERVQTEPTGSFQAVELGVVSVFSLVLS